MYKSATEQQQVETWCSRHRITPAELESLINKVKDSYTLIRRTYHPKYAGPKKGAKRTAWRKVAMRVYERGWNINEFVASCFRLRGAGTQPEHMLTAGVETDITRDKLARLERLRTGLRSYAFKLEQRMNMGENIEVLLRDQREDFDPVFVWCIAVLADLDDLANDYRLIAKRRLEDSDEVRAVYTEAFPEVINAAG